MEAFSLFAKLTLDSSQFDNGLKQAKSSMESIGSGISKVGSAFTSSASAIGHGLATAAKVGAAAVVTASTAVGALVAKSVSAYSDYEQLVGGVQKLYGNMGMTLEEYAKQQGKTSDAVRKDWERNEKAADLMMKNANNAFKTAGMSANQYMEVATSFSASLIGSLGGDTLKAAEMTDVAMRAISDNWNTFGGDLTMIQGAFQGFAKQNYTMLDNLKLGYGGTKQEMQRLIKDANEYGKTIGLNSKLTIDSFADIVTAIELIQKKQQIYGTTAREASTTIQGSLGMVKAAWENMLTGMSNKGANFNKLINDLVDSIAGYDMQVGNTTEHVNGLIDNVLPVAEKAIQGVSTLIEKVFPKIARMIPELVDKVLPQLMNAGADIISAFGESLYDNLDTILNTGKTIIDSLLGRMVAATKSGKSYLMEIIMSIAEFFNNNLDKWLEMGIQIIKNIVEGMLEYKDDLIKTMTDIALKLVDAFVELYPFFIDVGLEILVAIAQSLAENVDTLIQAGIDLITALVDIFEKHAEDLWEAGKTILEALYKALMDNLPTILDGATELILKFIDKLTEDDNLAHMIDAGLDIVEALIDGIMEALPKLKEKIPDIIEQIKKGFEEHEEAQALIGAAIAMKIVGGIAAHAGLFSKVGETLTGALSKALTGAGLENTLMTYSAIFKGSLSMLKANVSTAMSSIGMTLKAGIASVGQFFTADLGATMAAGGTTAVATAGTAIVGSVIAFFGGAELGKKIGAMIFPDDADLYEHYSGITGTFEMLGDFFVTFGERTVEHWNNLKQATAEKWGEMKEAVSGAVEAINTAVNTKVDDVKQKVASRWNELKQNTSTAWENVKSNTQTVWNTTKDNVVTAAQTLGDRTREHVSNLKNRLSTLWSEAKTAASNTWNQIKENVTNAAKTLYEKTREQITQVPRTIKEKVGEAVDYLKSLPSKTAEWGRDFVKSFIDGITGKLSDLKSKVREMADDIRSYLHFSEPDVGPLSDFHTYAPDMIDLFIKGLKDNTSKLQNQISRTFDFDGMVKVPTIGDLDNTVTVNSSTPKSGTSITMNIYGAQGQDVEELADIVSDRIMFELGQTGAVYA